MKKYLHEIWMVVSVIVIIALSIIAKTELIKIVASVCGVIYILGVAKQSRISQIFGLVNTAIYAYLMVNDKLYGSAIYNGLYCLPMLIYTYFKWGKAKENNINKENNEIKVSTYSVPTRCYLIMVAIIIITVYYAIATKLGVNHALVDAITITFGGFGMYAVSKKKIEQWYSFIFLNIANISLWIINSIIDPSNITMIFMFVVYMVSNIYGLFIWKKEMKNNEKISNKLV